MATTPHDLFLVYNAPGASDFHDAIVAAILAGGVLPEALADLLTLTHNEQAQRSDGREVWIVNFA